MAIMSTCTRETKSTKSQNKKDSQPNTLAVIFFLINHQHVLVRFSVNFSTSAMSITLYVKQKLQNAISEEIPACIKADTDLVCLMNSWELICIAGLTLYEGAAEIV